MKLKQIYDEMLELAKNLDIPIQNGAGNFRGGDCVVNDKKVIVLNKSVPLESKAKALAKCLSKCDIDKVFVKPAIRDFIEKEKTSEGKDKEYEIVIE